MLSGFNTLVDCVAIGVFGCGVALAVFLLNRFFPPFKKFFDKLVNGEL
jgi:hypothetical protein